MTNAVIIYIKQNIRLFDSFDNVYLLGSILSLKELTNDIDILLIYSKYNDIILTNINRIYSILERKFSLPID